MNPAGALIFILKYVFDIYIMIVLARFILQLVRADFYNPVSQFIVKVTTPILKPLRRIIPGFGGIDVASIVLMITLVLVKIIIIILISYGSIAGLSPVTLAITTLNSAANTVLNFYLFCIFIGIIFSWVSQGAYNPFAALMQQITEPVLAPARKLIPAMGGLDLSPMLVIMLITAIKILFGLGQGPF
ncbi:hypothetical protein A9Q99_24735 [Gammaproteobacteria bacterium 45_16_T64]|nr:hypothetical protein A9Q99_24735 [Gammaproteobacteria bacterium 45_16_T64]